MNNYLNEFYSSQGIFEAEYLTDAVYKLEHCEACRLIYQKYIPNNILMQRLYDHWIDPELSRQRNLSFNLRNLAKKFNNFHEILRLLMFFKRAPKRLRILDYGCGWSQWLVIARIFGIECYGHEYSEARIAHLRKKKIRLLDMMDSEIRFDYINTEQVFEHVGNPAETFEFLAEKLKAGGVLKVSTPDCRKFHQNNHSENQSAQDELYKAPELTPLEHINGFSNNTLIKMAEQHGLELINSPRWFTTSLVQMIRKMKNPKFKPLDSTYLFFIKPKLTPSK